MNKVTRFVAAAGLIGLAFEAGHILGGEGASPGRSADMKESFQSGVLSMSKVEQTRSVETRIEINAPIEAVWKALTDGEELMRWFPLQARVKPGVGGSVWMSWGGAWEGESPIEVWEPNKRLRAVWPQTGESHAEGPTKVAVDYYLESRGGTTVLRLVHSGFGVGAAWDKEYDGVTRGWAFELRGLRHYLENHRGKNRRVIWTRKGTKLAASEAMRRVIGQAGQVVRGKIEGLKEGDAYRLELVGADRPIEGIVAVNNAPRSFSGTVKGLNNGLFRCEIESCGKGGSDEVWVWFSTYGLEASEVEKLTRHLEQTLESTLAS